MLDFRTRNPSVTVGGDLAQIQDGATGPLYRDGDGFRWTRAGLARIVDWRGRMLWRAWGGPDAWARPPEGAMRALSARGARLEFRGLK